MGTLLNLVYHGYLFFPTPRDAVQGKNPVKIWRYFAEKAGCMFGTTSVEAASTG